MFPLRLRGCASVAPLSARSCGCASVAPRLVRLCGCASIPPHLVPFFRETHESIHGARFRHPGSNAPGRREPSGATASVQAIARQREPFSHPIFWGALEPGWRTRVSWAGSRRVCNQSPANGSFSRIQPFSGALEPGWRTRASWAGSRRAYNQSPANGSLSRIQPFGERWSQDGELEFHGPARGERSTSRSPAGAFLASSLLGSVGARMANPSPRSGPRRVVQAIALRWEPFSHPTFWGALEPGWRNRARDGASPKGWMRERRWENRQESPAANVDCED